MRSFRTLRARLTALAVLAAFLSITALTVAFNLVLGSSLDGDANSRLRSRAAAARTTTAFARGHLTVKETPGDAALDQRVWVYEGRRAIQRPVARPSVQRAADSLRGRDGVFHDLADRDLRLYANAITRRGRQGGTVVTGESLSAYDRTADFALAGSLILGAGLLAAMGALSWVVVGRALTPVGEMTRTAADWSAHDPGRRFGPQRRDDELGDLARTFDGLLDRVTASIRHEQQLSAELSHELRTPLARIVAELELLQRREHPPEERREALSSASRSAEQMSRILETLMAAARTGARLDHGRVNVGNALERVAAEWEPQFAERELRLALERPAQPLDAGVEADVLERILAPLLDNAVRMARSRVVLGARTGAEGVAVTVTDDGPGVLTEEASHVFE